MAKPKSGRVFACIGQSKLIDFYLFIKKGLLPGRLELPTFAFHSNGTLLKTPCTAYKYDALTDCATGAAAHEGGFDLVAASPGHLPESLITFCSVSSRIFSHFKSLQETKNNQQNCNYISRPIKMHFRGLLARACRGRYVDAHPPHPSKSG